VRAGAERGLDGVGHHLLALAGHPADGFDGCCQQRPAATGGADSAAAREDGGRTAIRPVGVAGGPVGQTLG
jgi:hypothetical protein